MLRVQVHDSPPGLATWPPASKTAQDRTPPLHCIAVTRQAAAGVGAQNQWKRPRSFYQPPLTLFPLAPSAEQPLPRSRSRSGRPPISISPHPTLTAGLAPHSTSQQSAALSSLYWAFLATTRQSAALRALRSLHPVSSHLHSAVFTVCLTKLTQPSAVAFTALLLAQTGVAAVSCRTHTGTHGCTAVAVSCLWRLSSWLPRRWGQSS